MTPEEQIKELRDKINYHSDRYYNQDSPEISDYEFDMLMQQLKKLEKEHPERGLKNGKRKRKGAFKEHVKNDSWVYFIHISDHRTDLDDRNICRTENKSQRTVDGDDTAGWRQSDCR